MVASRNLSGAPRRTGKTNCATSIIILYIQQTRGHTSKTKANSRTTSTGELANASLRRKVNRMIDKKGGWSNHPRPVSWLWARTRTIPEPPCRSRPRVAADALAPLRPVHRPAAARAGLHHRALLKPPAIAVEPPPWLVSKSQLLSSPRRSWLTCLHRRSPAGADPPSAVAPRAPLPRAAKRHCFAITRPPPPNRRSL